MPLSAILFLLERAGVPPYEPHLVAIYGADGSHVWQPFLRDREPLGPLTATQRDGRARLRAYLVSALREVTAPN